MRERATRNLFGLAVVALSAAIVASCVTINLYFPEKEVKDLAAEIEKQVQATAEAAGATSDDPATPEGSSPQSRGNPTPPTGDKPSVGLIGTLLGVTPAYAQEIPEPEITNPAIRKIIDSRAARLAQINGYKSSGVLGENNEGDLEIRNLGAVSDLRARAEVQKLVRAENADREQLYQQIAAAKNIDPSQLARIRETYAETLRENARPGDWIQLPDGSWKQQA